MKIKSINLETVCGITSKLPENSLLEIAFAGRSNVGKSSLINSLAGRNHMQGLPPSLAKPRQSISTI